MSESKNCCSAAPKLIFACSGAADVGAIADQAARKLTREGKGKMFCLAGIGGRVSGIMKSTRGGRGRFWPSTAARSTASSSAWKRPGSANSSTCNWQIWDWLRGRASRMTKISPKSVAPPRRAWPVAHDWLSLPVRRAVIRYGCMS